MLDEAVVVLGSALTIRASGHHGGGVVTTIANDAVGLANETIFCGQEPCKAGNTTYGLAAAPPYFWQNGTGYVLLSPATGGDSSADTLLEVNITNRTGTWKALGTPSPSAPVTMRTFSLRILHSHSTTRFGYVLLPVVKLTDMPQIAACLRSPCYGTNSSATGRGGGSRWHQLLPVAPQPAVAVQVLSNTAGLHAVYEPTSKLVQCTFIDPTATLQLPMPNTVLGTATVVQVGVSMPVMLIVRRVDASTVLLSASGADAGGTLTITISASLRCGEQQLHRSPAVVKLQLPTSAELLGKSVTTTCMVGSTNE